MSIQRFKLEQIRYKAGEYKCEDCGLLCIAGEVIRADDFDRYAAENERLRELDNFNVRKKKELELEQIRLREALRQIADNNNAGNSAAIAKRALGGGA